MIKIVILDLDGTLLNSKKEITEYNCAIIKKLKNKVKFVLASARSFIRIKPYLEKLDLINDENYTIAFNGSLVLNNNEQVILDEEIDISSKKLLYNFVQQHLDVDWFYYTYDEMINNKDINDVVSFLNNNKIYKVVCVAHINTINTLRNNLSDDLVQMFSITSSESNRIEFVQKGNNKVKSIQILLNKLNICKEEMIAIGDGENDIEMIKYAGIGIAMDNASKTVKESSDLVTTSNDADGVGKILDQLLIEKIRSDNMMDINEYKEHEIKVLDVDIENLKSKLEQLGAKKVYDDTRTIIALDTPDRYFLTKKDKLIRVTDEGSIKVTMHVNQSTPEKKAGIKFKTSRLKETMDFFHEMGLDAITKVSAPRISYELGKIDFDIDQFPAIPPFLEIYIEYLKEEGYSVDELLKKLELANNKVVVMGTEDIHKLYGIDYFEVYKSL